MALDEQPGCMFEHLVRTGATHMQIQNRPLVCTTEASLQPRILQDSQPEDSHTTALS